MRLLLSLIATSFAQSFVQTYSKWNWDESRIYFNYNGGLKDMVVDLFSDYGYPSAFTDMFDNASDESMILNIASWDASTKNSLATEITADNGLFSFYTELLTLINQDTFFSADALQIAVYDTFLQEKLASSGSDLTIMDLLVSTYFDETVALAVDYVALGDDTNEKASRMVDVLKNVKNAIKEYNADVGIKMGTGTALMNYVNVAVPLVYRSAWMYEAYVDRNDILFTMMDEITNAMTTIVMDPLSALCDQAIGPFEAMRQMVLAVSHIVETFEEFMEFTVEIDDYISLWFFGDREHYPWEWGLFMETYVWQYTNYMKSLRGPIEGQLHLWSIIFDDVVADMVNGLIQQPICGL